MSATGSEPFSDLGCREIVSLWGGVIAKLPKVNTMTGPSFKLKYKEGHHTAFTEGFQEYSQFEGAPAEVLHYNEPAGLEVALRSVPAEITFEEKVEFRALP